MPTFNEVCVKAGKKHVSKLYIDSFSKCSTPSLIATRSDVSNYWEVFIFFEALYSMWEK